MPKIKILQPIDLQSFLLVVPSSIYVKNCCILQLFAGNPELLIVFEPRKPLKFLSFSAKSWFINRVVAYKCFNIAFCNNYFMRRFQPSIRGKVNYAYYFGIVLIVIISFLNYFNLTRLNRKVEFGFVISELYDTALEMRRYEKNYFLYGHEEDYRENLRFIKRAEDIINKNREAIKKLVIKRYVYTLIADIKEYKSLMQKHFEMNKDKMSTPLSIFDIENKIRAKGKKIIATAETISTAERRYIQSLIGFSKKILIGSGVFLIILGFFIADYLYRMVIKPLRQLENSMHKITSGEFSLLPTLSHDKELISLVKAFNKMLKELEVRQKRLVAQSEKLASLGTMASGIAHQLNNPLANIYTSCQILLEEIEESDINTLKNTLQQMGGEVERAKTLVHSLLEFSKKREFKREPHSLKDIIDETIGFIKGEIPARVEVKTDIPEDIWNCVDKQRFQQAILNIIKNAIDAIPDEGTVHITAKEDLESKIVEIKIQDSGLGIEQENLDRIFEPFFTTKKDKNGTGLGLFVTSEIIKEHEGFIEVESELGQGTTFKIKLPVKEI